MCKIGKIKSLGLGTNFEYWIDLSKGIKTKGNIEKTFSKRPWEKQGVNGHRRKEVTLE